MSLMSLILGLSGAIPRFSSCNLFIPCFVLVAQSLVELQSERAVFCMWRERKKMSQSTGIILRKLDILFLTSVYFPESYLGNLWKSFPEMLGRAY